MSLLTRILFAFLTAAGAFYTFLGASTLVNLTAVTNRWIRLSGDPDFQLDFSFFSAVIGIGATVVAFLGLATAVGGFRVVRTPQHLRRNWGVLAVVALIVHVPWFVYRVIASGSSSSRGDSTSLRGFAIRSVVVCSAYVVAWLLTRRIRAGDAAMRTDNVRVPN